MTAQEWQLVKELFEAARVQPAEHRTRWLTDMCDQPHVRAEVDSLLISYDRAGVFLEKPAGGDLAAALTQFSPATLAGKRLGPWQLTEEIGAGGMGTVWRGVRADRAFDKVVAVKLISRGLDTEAVVRRFQQERQILASLSHPNITTLIDGGTTPGGLPYLVMEYVEGLPITTYCRERSLPLRTRLELFCAVCDAVEYAHRNRVLHRDLKPSNILVTRNGIPKLLDFGIAKILNPPTEDPATLTLGPVPLLTPEYASPEQIRAEALSQSADVYALGVVLYELVADRRPYEFNSRTPEEITAVVCAREHVSPSVASGCRELRGDVDNIVMTAIEKDPRFRYGSVAALSSELQNYLQGRPVRAARYPLAYQTRRFLRRNAVAAGGAVAASLFVAGITFWSSRREPEPRKAYRASTVSEANDYYERALAVENADWDLPRMIRLTRRAVELDPHFTDGRSRYAFFQLLMIDAGLSNDPVWLDRAESELNRVQREDGASALNHAHLAALSYYRRRWQDVERHAATAIRLDPGDVQGRIWLIDLLRLRGKWPAAIQLCRDILDRQPAFFPARMVLAMLYRYSGQLEECIRETEKTLDQNERLTYALMTRAYTQLDLRETAAARQTLTRARPQDRNHYPVRLTWALLLACEGDAEAALREADADTLRWAELFPEAPVFVAEIFSTLGQPENALAWLEKAVRGGDRRKSWLLRDPHLADVRRHRGFQRFLQSIPAAQ